MADTGGLNSRIKCSYESCGLVFDTEKDMRSHKKYSDEHDYCSRCNEDFESFDDYVQHKITRPDQHNKACRVCGEEFKSKSGLTRHIDLEHKIDQKLTCVGCQKSFWRACLFIQHLEYSECKGIPADVFLGHVVHKHLVADLLKNGPALDRFKQKTATYEAAIDVEVAGGVGLDDPLDHDAEIKDVAFEALRPDIPPQEPVQPAAEEYPSLPSSSKAASSYTPSLASALGGLTLGTNGKPSTMGNSPSISGYSASVCSASGYGASIDGSTLEDDCTDSHQDSIRSWNNSNGKTVSKVLFPNAKPTPATGDFSIDAHDKVMDQQHGINIMRTHFWDPMSSDWNPEKFFDPITCKYYCPFICEQMFILPSDLNLHIIQEHRVIRMKCPTCLKYFPSATALMAHCESRGSRCEIQKARDYNIFVDKVSGGFLAVTEMVREDHKKNPQVLLHNQETNRMELFQPPVATYLQYAVTKPPEWKEPGAQVTVVGGRVPQQARWA